jgi:hypothetical protein
LCNANKETRQEERQSKNERGKKKPVCKHYMSVSIERGGVAQLPIFGVHNPSQIQTPETAFYAVSANHRLMSRFSDLVIQLWMNMGIAGILGDAALRHVECHLQAPIHRV